MVDARFEEGYCAGKTISRTQTAVVPKLFQAIELAAKVIHLQNIGEPRGKFTTGKL